MGKFYADKRNVSVGQQPMRIISVRGRENWDVLLEGFSKGGSVFEN